VLWRKLYLRFWRRLPVVSGGRGNGVHVRKHAHVAAEQDEGCEDAGAGEEP
jgi:hypothetical protein